MPPGLQPAFLEASTESEWVARCVEELGHEVIVADPNFAPMCAMRSKRVKTDRRDARTLAEACRLLLLDLAGRWEHWFADGPPCRTAYVPALTP